CPGLCRESIYCTRPLRPRFAPSGLRAPRVHSGSRAGWHAEPALLGYYSRRRRSNSLSEYFAEHAGYSGGRAGPDPQPGRRLEQGDRSEERRVGKGGGSSGWRPRDRKASKKEVAKDETPAGYHLGTEQSQLQERGR